MSGARARVIGALGGLVLLGLMVLFAVGLPRWEGEGAQASPHSDDASAPAGPTGSIELPETLPGGFVALDSDQIPAALSSRLPDAGTITSGLKRTAGDLADLFGAPAQIRAYVNPTTQTFATVTVLDDDPGLFVPEGPPADPADTRPKTYDLVRVGDAVCAQYLGQPTDAQGQPVAGDPVPRRAHCQVGTRGRTVDVDVDLNGSDFEVLPQMITALTS